MRSAWIRQTRFIVNTAIVVVTRFLSRTDHVELVKLRLFCVVPLDGATDAYLGSGYYVVLRIQWCPENVVTAKTLTLKLVLAGDWSVLGLDSHTWVPYNFLYLYLSCRCHLMEWDDMVGRAACWAFCRSEKESRDMGPQQLPPSRQVTNVGLLGFWPDQLT
jgi:hypothetical protein